KGRQHVASNGVSRMLPMGDGRWATDGLLRVAKLGDSSDDRVLLVQSLPDGRMLVGHDESKFLALSANRSGSGIERENYSIRRLALSRHPVGQGVELRVKHLDSRCQISRVRARRARIRCRDSLELELNQLGRKRIKT